MKNNTQIIDCHIHVFSKSSIGLSAEARYIPPAKDIFDYAKIAKSQNITAAVIIQASVDGTNNSRILDTLKSARSDLDLRAVVMLEKGVDNLKLMHQLGVRAARVQDGKVFGKSQLYKVKEVSEQIAGYEWHIELNTRPESLSLLKDIVLSLPRGQALVLDHCAHIDPYSSVHKPALYDLLDTGRVWIKLCPVRVSKNPAVYDDQLIATICEIATRYPEKSIWGSDWPFVMLKEPLPRVDYMLATIKQFLGENVKHRLFYQNSKTLYGF